MKKAILLLALTVCTIQFYSCSTDDVSEDEITNRDILKTGDDETEHNEDKDD